MAGFGDRDYYFYLLSETYYMAGPCTGNQPADEYAVLCRILLYAAYYFSLSVSVSRLSNKVKRLTQEMALLEEQKRKAEEESEELQK